MVIFNFERKELTPPKWSLHLTPDVGGVYIVGVDHEAGAVYTAITFGKATWTRVETAVTGVRGQRCETKTKNIAQTGAKQLEFKLGVHEWVSCTFNYSDDGSLNDAASAFLAMAETVQMGEKLKHSLRFDRLGLDAEMDALVEEVKSGNAIEVQNIAPVLQTLIDDDRVMERVKRKAGHLLEGVGIPVKTTP